MCLLTQLAEKYRQMPNGGAALRVLPDGAISNGMAIVAKFANPTVATAALEEAGFDKRWNGWKAWKLSA